MPDSTTGTIEDAITSAIEKAGAPSPDPEASASAPSPTERESVSSPSEEAGESLTPNLRRIRESLKSDEEFQALPPEAQKVALKRLADHEKAFHKDKALMADTNRKAQMFDQLEGAGVTLEDVQQLLQAKAQGRPVTSSQVREVVQETGKTLRGLDRLLGKTEDAAQRESIRELRDVLKEELETLVESHPRTRALEQEVRSLRAATTGTRVGKLEAEIDGLEERFPSSLIEKYRSQIKATLSKPENMGVSARKVLSLLATDEELDEAQSYTAKQSTKAGETKPQRPTSQVSSPAVSDQELAGFKHKKGGWDLSAVVEHLTGKAMPAGR